MNEYIMTEHEASRYVFNFMLIVIALIIGFIFGYVWKWIDTIPGKTLEDLIEERWGNSHDLDKR